ncbi:hypothetical protein CERSUDRAFT_74243 [Gelatoporia subvermispora B]|uniref:Phytase-like domain-containing protein n=1 Tax=Ceriporiopsis subvermispora (strain B) TaxID=914234 RepID=M2QVT9_CERS8|nr:hypothetical protein CERSUDRAFT_74243 [Gelatoporia subvermispora B]
MAKFTVALQLYLAYCLSLVAAGPLKKLAASPTEPDPSFAVSVKVAGQTFVNKGLVAFGLIPSNFTDSTGNTFGGVGSAIAIKPGSFAQTADGNFTGTLIVQPDRGFNVDGTVDYQARQHVLDFKLSPYYSADDLSFTAAQSTLQLTYQDTLLYFEREHTATTGLDALAVRPADSGFPTVISADPAMPIPATDFSHLTVDAEGLALNQDGSFFVSDEYGPYIYLIDASGNLVETIQPPEAFLPLIDGALNFTGSVNPDTGRVANQGFEGLTLDNTGTTLYALLQSALVQDGGDDDTTSSFTRLLAFDVSSPLTQRPPVIGEWVVPLPQSKKGKTRAASEVHFVGGDVFLVLSRDGHGHGDSNDDSSYKQADLIDISGATDIHGTQFDFPNASIATKGKLDKSITAAEYVSFVNFIDDTQLARFGLHNGDPDDQTLIDAKWESLALAPCFDPDFPNDFFLFTADVSSLISVSLKADNDFLTEDGFMNGVPYNAGINNDNQFLVFRLTLPTAPSNDLR